MGRDHRPQAVLSVDATVSAAISNLVEQLDAAGCTVQLVHPLPSVCGDFANLASLFHNLLSNSLKYRKPDIAPIIPIEAKPAPPADWIICVKDNGIGVAPEYHHQIFEPFKRLHGHGIPGTGIGPALCRRIVESYGGHIGVESALGEGSTVCFTLRGG